MSTPQRQKNKIRSTINEFLIPETGEFGDIWHARAENTLWYATRSGLVVSLSDVLNNEPARGPKESLRGPQGPQGPPGDITVVGDAELHEAVVKLRKREAAWHAAWLTALQRNAGRRHPGLKSAIDSVLQKLKEEANVN
jgi:alpha-D-ribose 1-methylphosphonate 5-triphosphate synthase subunit PhnG